MEMKKKFWRLWFALCAFFEPKETGRSVKYNIRIGKIYPDGEPKRCMCGHDKFRMKNDSYIGGQILEYELYCKHCRALVAQWSCGSFIP